MSRLVVLTHTNLGMIVTNGKILGRMDLKTYHRKAGFLKKSTLLVFALLCIPFIGFSTNSIGDPKSYLQTNIVKEQASQYQFNGSPIDLAKEYVGDAQDAVTEIKDLYGKVTDNATLQTILNGKEVKFPIKITSKNGDPNTAIILKEIKFTPTGGLATICMRFPVGEEPDGDGKKYLYFYGSDIAFSKSGGFTGAAAIGLVETVEIPIGGEPEAGKEAKVEIHAIANDTRKTYMVFSCDGFEQLHLNADLVFSREVLVPEMPDGKASTDVNERVKANFEVDITGWNEWMVAISLDRFQSPDLPGFSMEVENLILDNTELKNVESESLGAVLEQVSDKGNSPLWKGVYLEHIYCKLPESLQNASKDSPRELEGFDLVIDENGFSGLIQGNNLIEPKDGQMGDWQFYLKMVAVEFRTNDFVGGALAAEVILPVSKSDTESGTTSSTGTGSGTGTGGVPDVTELQKQPAELPGAIAIAGSITPSESGNGMDYSLSANVTSALNFNALKMANVTLDKGSRVDVDVIEGKFQAEAVLFGNVDIIANRGDAKTNETASAEKSDVSMSAEFSDIVFRTHASPKIELRGSFALENKNEVGNFPVSLRRLELIQKLETEELGAKLDIAISFMDNNAGFGGSTVFTLWAQKSAQTKKYKFSRAELNSIYVEVEQGALSLKGRVDLFNEDLIYGSGFRGCLEAKFEPNIDIYVEGMFGRKTAENENDGTFKYWYAYAKVGLPTAIPIFPAVGINAFSGGAYYHLAPANEDDLTNPLYAEYITQLEEEKDNGEFQCKSAFLIPNESTALGIKAGIGLQSLPSDYVFNGHIEFTVQFNESFSPNYIAFEGAVDILNEPGQDDPSIRVDWLTEFDIDKKILSGNFNVYVNVVDVIRGIHEPNNKAGSLSFYVSPDDWYVYMGKPLEPIGVEILGFLELRSYMVCGSILPTPPIAPLPSDINLPVDIDYAALNTGAGFAFGVRAKVEAKAEGKIKIKRSEIYAGFRASVEAGVDVLLSKSSVPIYCSGMEPEGDGRGIKGWYATGQAYLKGEVDVSAGVRGRFNFEITLVSFALRAGVFAQLPNPSYFVGVVEIEVEVGPFKKKVDANVEVGETCDVPIDRSLDLPLVLRTTPGYQAQDGETPEMIETVDVFARPAIELVYAVGYNLSFKHENKDESDVVYTIGHDESTFSIVCEDCGDICPTCPNGVMPIAGDLRPSNNLKRFTFYPNEVLPGGKTFRMEYTAEATSNFSHEYKDALEPVYVRFKTKEEPILISNQNVAYSYPLPDMRNFYPEESNRGYLQTIIKQNNPFLIPEDRVWEVRYLQGDNIVFASRSMQVDANAQPGTGAYNFEFPIPEGLELDSDYRLQIVQAALGELPEEPDYVPGVAVQGIPLNSIVEDAITIVSYPFHTSSFRTFNDKFANYVHVTSVESQGIIKLELDGTGASGETFSSEEFRGYGIADAQLEPLVQLSSKELNPDIVEAYDQLKHDLEDKLGTTTSVSLQDAVKLSQANGDFMIDYQIPNAFISLIGRIDSYNSVAEVMDPTTKIDIPSDIPSFEAGTYSYQMAYYLPGQDVPTSVAHLGFNVANTIELSNN